MHNIYFELQHKQQVLHINNTLHEHHSTHLHIAHTHKCTEDAYTRFYCILLMAAELVTHAQIGACGRLEWESFNNTAILILSFVTDRELWS